MFVGRQFLKYSVDLMILINPQKYLNKFHKVHLNIFQNLELPHLVDIICRYLYFIHNLLSLLLNTKFGVMDTFLAHLT